jgi:integrase
MAPRPKPRMSNGRGHRGRVAAEIEALLRAVPLDHPYGPTDHALFLTAVMSGLRQGELLALRWRDIGWMAGRIRVRRNYVRGHWVSPKSKRGIRSVPLADRLAGELERHFQSSNSQGDDELVVGHPPCGPGARPLGARPPLQGGAEGGQGAPGQIQRLAAQLCDRDGGGGRADADPSGMDGTPRLQDDSRLCRPRAERWRGRAHRASVRSGHQFGHQSNCK